MTDNTQAVEAAEFLPCPLCGANARLANLAGWEISCSCGLNFCLATSDKGRLLKKWNSRAALTSQQVAEVKMIEAEKAWRLHLDEANRKNWHAVVFDPKHMNKIVGELDRLRLAASRPPAQGVAGGVDASRGYEHQRAIMEGHRAEASEIWQNEMDYTDAQLKAFDQGFESGWNRGQAQPSPHPAVGGSGGVPVASGAEPVGDLLIEAGRFNGFGYRSGSNLPDGEYKLYTHPTPEQGRPDVGEGE